MSASSVFDPIYVIHLVSELGFETYKDAVLRTTFQPGGRILLSIDSVSYGFSDHLHGLTVQDANNPDDEVLVCPVQKEDSPCLQFTGSGYECSEHFKMDDCVQLSDLSGESDCSSILESIIVLYRIVSSSCDILVEDNSHFGSEMDQSFDPSQHTLSETALSFAGIAASVIVAVLAEIRDVIHKGEGRPPTDKRSIKMWISEQRARTFRSTLTDYAVMLSSHDFLNNSLLFSRMDYGHFFYDCAVDDCMKLGSMKLGRDKLGCEDHALTFARNHLDTRRMFLIAVYILMRNLFPNIPDCNRNKQCWFRMLQYIAAHDKIFVTFSGFSLVIKVKTPSFSIAYWITDYLRGRMFVCDIPFCLRRKIRYVDLTCDQCAKSIQKGIILPLPISQLNAELDEMMKDI